MGYLWNGIVEGVVVNEEGLEFIVELEWGLSSLTHREYDREVEIVAVIVKTFKTELYAAAVIECEFVSFIFQC
jgi:hypothetical protein